MEPILISVRNWLRRLVGRRSSKPPAARAGAVEALSDLLTGLPTRQRFEGVLAQAASQADAASRSFALLAVNIDGLKFVNQTHGHAAGDALLRRAAKRLRRLVKPHMAARLAGDEFLLLLPDDPTAAEASAFAARVVAELARPYAIGAREVSVTTSVGLTMYPEHGAMSAMITHAQAAMMSAKAAGGAGHMFFDLRMIKGRRDEMELLSDLRLALERSQMELFYQPKIHAESGEITGAEALLRWHHPTRGVVSPADFIPLAERSGLIAPLGNWVIDEAFRQARSWRDTGLRMRVAINLSVHQLRQVELATQIEAALKCHQINPDLITCEITESSAMDDPERMIDVLRQLNAIGVHIAIDDFGTGHSSLAYLLRLPADELKIDRSFVMDLETSENARKVALAVINLAKALDLKVVAEGVETEAQNRILREFGCDQLQGFLFAKPMSAKALAIWAIDDIGPRTLNWRDSLFKETAPIPLHWTSPITEMATTETVVRAEKTGKLAT